MKTVRLDLVWDNAFGCPHCNDVIDLEPEILDLLSLVVGMKKEVECDVCKNSYEIKVVETR